MNTWFILQCIFLAGGGLISVIAGLHVRAYMTANSGINSVVDVDRYRDVVRFQMWATVTYLMVGLPAIVIGVISAWNSSLLVAILGSVPFWIAVMPSLVFRSFERRARSQKALNAELQKECDELSLHWKKGFLPRV